MDIARFYFEVSFTPTYIWRNILLSSVSIIMLSDLKSVLLGVKYDNMTCYQKLDSATTRYHYMHIINIKNLILRVRLHALRFK